MKKVLEIRLFGEERLTERLLYFARSFNYVTILKSNKYEDKYGKYEVLAAFGAARIYQDTAEHFEGLKKSHEQQPTWLFGHLSYDLKNELEKLNSRNPSKFTFDPLFFYEPAYLFIQKRGTNVLEVFTHEDADEAIIHALFDAELEGLKLDQSAFSSFKSKETKQEYLHNLKRLKGEIQQGNIYEINYCTEFYLENVAINPEATYYALNQRSPMPFSVYHKVKEDYVLGASPERFICKRGNKIVSQPIKGTVRRGITEEEDTQLKSAIKRDIKEQTENVMIVDLVRNDLSRTATRGSVSVEELFGVYTFPQVHQLISTISSQLAEKYHFTEAIKYAFPMGSMTGAPKISAMKIADQLECSKRELYSGSIGYISPEGEFDFNVVIRSILYSSKTNYLSLTVGGAVTIMSDPEKEYEECLLKAKAIFDLNKADQ